jgi:hypothetical protein
MYGLVLATGALVAARLPGRAAAVVLASAAALQAADLSPRFARMRTWFTEHYVVQPTTRTTPLTARFWTEAAAHYRAIRVAPVTHMARGWEWLGLHAVEHGMAVGTGCFARVSAPRLAAANAAVEAALAHGPLDAGSLYLLWTPDAKFAWAIGPDDGAGTVDGYFVVAPGWFARAQGPARNDLLRGPRRGVAP